MSALRVQMCARCKDVEGLRILLRGGCDKTVTNNGMIPVHLLHFTVMLSPWQFSQRAMLTLERLTPSVGLLRTLLPRRAGVRAFARPKLPAQTSICSMRREGLCGLHVLLVVWVFVVCQMLMMQVQTI